MICIGKMRGILSMLEFDEEDNESTAVCDKLYDILRDMEMLIKGVEDLPYS